MLFAHRRRERVERATDRQASVPQPSARPTAAAGTLGSAELRRVTGDWHSDELDVVYRVMLLDSALMLRRPNRRDVPLVPVDRNTFRAAGDAQSDAVTLHFANSGAAPPTWFTIEAGRVTNIRFRRR